MQLSEAVTLVPEFARWNHADRVKYFAWFLHTERSKDYFTAADIRKCFEELNMDGPASVGPFLSAMDKRRPKEALKVAKGYKLEKRVREAFDSKYGEREVTIAIHKMLSELPAKVPGIEERDYLKEALLCLRHKAFRAAIVMACGILPTTISYIGF